MDKFTTGAPVNYHMPRAAVNAYAHPEMGCPTDASPAALTVTELAAVLGKNLSDAVERADRIIGRIVGPEPVGLGQSTPPASGLAGLMAENCCRLDTLLAMLDRIESRIGG